MFIWTYRASLNSLQLITLKIFNAFPSLLRYLVCLL